MQKEPFEIKPIETFYKGYRFRSRTEARWAVILDALGAKWEYEPEGYELGNGLRYLPDFVVHNVYARGDDKNNVYNKDMFLEPSDVYIEVKGVPTDEDKKKVYKFVGSRFDKDGRWYPLRPILVVGGLPGFKNLGEFFNECYDQFVKSGGFFYSYSQIDNDYYAAYLGISKNGNVIIQGDHYWKYGMDIKKTSYAYIKGLQARFEHGETP